MSGSYYNEIDPFCVKWLRNLIAAGHIADGEVDDRSIVEVQPDDLHGFTQCHFFAGLGGWSHALRLAGWPDDRPVWTGSAPCQPFSTAGKREGHADERHLAPVWLRLIEECRPAIVFGEQVGAAVGMGWLDALFISLEQADYACGAAVFPAASVGAFHIRERLYFVAKSERAGREARLDISSGSETRSESIEECGSTLGVADADRGGAGRSPQAEQGGDGQDNGISRPDGTTGVVGDSDDAGSQGHRGLGVEPIQEGRDGTERYNHAAGFWSDAIWLPCRDGKARPTKPGIQPLAHGVPGRVGRLRGYGNAIIPQQAAAFIRSAIEVMP